MGFHEGDMTARDYLANRDAKFCPAVHASDNNGAYAPPCIEIGGVQVYAYVRDGILVVSLHYDTADISDAGPWAVYDGSCIPTVIDASGIETVPVWTALPENAVSQADARQLRKVGVDEPGDWVVPAWVQNEPDFTSFADALFAAGAATAADQPDTLRELRDGS